MYKFDEKPKTSFTPETLQTIEKIKGSEISIICGRNNGGKSFLLKTMKQQIGEEASYLGPARYANFHILGVHAPKKGQKRKTREHHNFMSNFQNETQNIDNSNINLQQAIAELSDSKRQDLKEIMESLLALEMEIKLTVQNNEMSQRYIAVGDHNISFTSSGVRLVATLITSLLDEEFNTFLIDEPELGISPETQGLLADFIFNKKNREKYFSHIKTLIIATHSTSFLDRDEIKNNYYCDKLGDEIELSQMESLADISRLHFYLLGNRIEALYLPSAIIIVEGKCDKKFIEKALAVRFPEGRFSVIAGNADNKIKEIFKNAQNIFGEFQKSPYVERIVAVLDKRHQKGLTFDLEKMGMKKENIIVWSKNGIEYFYPKTIIQEIFGGKGKIQIEDDLISLNEISFKKNDLCEKMLSKLNEKIEFEKEFEERFLHRIKEILA